MHIVYLIMKQNKNVCYAVKQAKLSQESTLFLHTDPFGDHTSKHVNYVCTSSARLLSFYVFLSLLLNGI